MSIRVSNIRSAGLATAALCSAVTGAWASEYGTVISSTPVVTSVPVVQRECVNEPVATRPRTSGTGALIGAIAGAAFGNAVGSGTGRAVATGIGMVAGAALGDHAEAQEAASATTMAQRCRDVTRHEQRAVGYDVVYEYQGVRRSVRLAQPPGDRIALEVSVAPAGQAAPLAPYGAPAVTYTSPAPMPAPVYRSPADTPYADEAPPPRTVYAPQPVYAAPAPAYASPWPYIVVGGIGAWYLAHQHGGRRGGGHWRHR